MNLNHDEEGKFSSGGDDARARPRSADHTPAQARAIIRAEDAIRDRPRATSPKPMDLRQQTSDLVRHPFTGDPELEARRRAQAGPHLLSDRSDLHGADVTELHEHLQRRATRDLTRRSIDGPPAPRAKGATTKKDTPKAAAKKPTTRRKKK